MTPDLGIMTEEALAELLGLELATMANRRTKGELPAHIKPGRRVRSRLQPTIPARVSAARASLTGASSTDQPSRSRAVARAPAR